MLTAGPPLADEVAGDAAAQAPLAHRAVRGGMWVSVSSWWTIAVGFAANIALTRLLAPEAFGVFSLAMFFAQVLRVQPRLGLSYAYGQHPRTDAESTATFVALDLGAAAAGLALILAAAPLLLTLGYEALTVRVVVLLGLAATAESLTSTGATLLEKELRFGPVSAIQALAFPLSYAPALALALRGEGVWSLVAQNVTYNLLFLAGIVAVLGRGRRLRQVNLGPSRALARRYLRFGAGVGLGLLGVTLLTQLDHFLVGSLVGVGVLGYYDRAYRTAQWPSVLLSAVIARTGFYTYARLQNDPARRDRALRMMVWLIAALGMPVGLAVYAAAPDLLVLLYGERWLPSVSYLRILALVAAVRPLVDHAHVVMAAGGTPWLAVRLTGAQVLILVAVGLPLVWWLGAIGACVAVAAATAAGLALALRRLDALAPGAPRELVAPALAALVAFVGITALHGTALLVNLSPATRVLAQGSFAVALFGAVVVAVQPGRARERVAWVLRLARAE